MRDAVSSFVLAGVVCRSTTPLVRADSFESVHALPNDFAACCFGAARMRRPGYGSAAGGIRRSSTGFACWQECR